MFILFNNKRLSDSEQTKNVSVALYQIEKYRKEELQLYAKDSWLIHIGYNSIQLENLIRSGLNEGKPKIHTLMVPQIFR